MKTVIYRTISMIIGLALVSVTTYAQIDNKRMERDIKVASNVLKSLLHEGEHQLFMLGGGVEGSHIDGYGVFFNISGNFRSISIPEHIRFGRFQTPERPPMLAENEKIKENEFSFSLDSSSTDNHNQERIIDGVTTFLIDYSHLIGQLSPSDKIIIKHDGSRGSTFLAPKITDNGNDDWQSNSNSQSLSFEVVKKDHSDYLIGKLSRDELKERIKIIKGKSGRITDKDIDMFSLMIRTAYDPKYSDTYFMSWGLKYEMIEGVGVLFSGNLFSSYEEGKLFRMPTIHEDELTNEERKEKAVALYPIFVNQFKNDLIHYAKTINSLEPDEMIILKFKLTRCEGCSIPKEVTFSVKQSFLTTYNAGEVSLTKTVEKVLVSEK